MRGNAMGDTNTMESRDMDDMSMDRMQMGRQQRSTGMRDTRKAQVAEDVYNKINEHMCKALAFHEQLADYFCFLGLHGYKRMLEYQYMCECAEKRKLHRRYIDIHQKIIPVKQVQIPVFIPADWSRYTVEDIDDSVVPKFVRAALKEWKSWEEKTKELYEQQCEVLQQAGLVPDYEFVKKLVVDVEKELKKIVRIIESLNGTGYDVNTIHGMQDKYHEKYKKKYNDRFTTKNSARKIIYDKMPEWDDDWDDYEDYRGTYDERINVPGYPDRRPERREEPPYRRRIGY